MVVVGQVVPRRKRRSVLLLLIQLLLGIGLLLLLVNSGLWLLRQTDRPATGKDGEILYATTFDAATEAWSQEPGQASTSVTEGVLRIAIDERNSIYSALPFQYNNFDAKVNAVVTAANGDYGVAALLFRLRDKGNYYIFKIRGDGAYRIERFQNGTLDIVSEWQINPTIRVGIGAINQLRVRAVGSLFTFYVNDLPLPLCLKGSDKRSTWQGLTSGACLSNGGKLDASYTDSTFEYGKLALGADADVPGLRVDFDNVLIVAAQ